MDRKPRSSNDLTKRLRNIFLGRNSLTPDPTLFIPGPGVTESESGGPLMRDVILTEEVMTQLAPQSPLPLRLKMVNYVLDQMTRQGFEQYGIETVWLFVRDILHDSARPSEARHIVWQLMQQIIRIHLKSLNQIRALFFIDIQTGFSEDLDKRLESFDLLTSGGKLLDYFEEETGPFLVEIIQECSQTKFYPLLFKILIDIFTYSAGHIDPEVVSVLLKSVVGLCFCSEKTLEENEMQYFLDLFKAVISYSSIPRDALEHVVTCLCLLVNRVNQAWEVARHLLGTHNGSMALSYMSKRLEHGRPQENLIVRGAVFLIGMALWGPQKINSISKSTWKMLDPFLKGLQHGDLLVAHEEVLAIDRLLRKNSEDLTQLDWTIVLEIVETIITIFKKAPETSENEYKRSLEKLLLTLENAHANRNFIGNEDKLIEIWESFYLQRPESSVKYLMDIKTKWLLSPLEIQLFDNLSKFINMFYVDEPRDNIRCYCLKKVKVIYENHSCDIFFERDFINNVVNVYLTDIAKENCSDIRESGAKLLLKLLNNASIGLYPENTALYQELTALIDQIFLSPCLVQPLSSDLETIANQYWQIFFNKLMTIDCPISLWIFKSMITFLDQFYKNSKNLSHEVYLQYGGIKKLIFSSFLSLKCDEKGCIGYISLPGMSPTQSFDRQTPSSSSSPSFGMEPDTITTLHYNSLLVATREHAVDDEMLLFLRKTVNFLPFSDCLERLITCINQELDWTVFKCMLDGLISLLQQRDLVLKTPSVIVALCQAMIKSISDRKLCLPERLLQCPLSVHQFHNYVSVVLSHLVGFPITEKSIQVDLLEILHQCLMPPYNLQCISALSLALFEMPEAMRTLIHPILLKMSKLSSNASLATLVLEFLSMLVHVPTLYASFTDKQYIMIFAIILPYTSPFRFNNYIVALAYELIVTWFLKCRKSYRRFFTTFIMKSLRSHVLRLLEEVNDYRHNSQTTLTLLNESSEDRKRGMSLNEKIMRRSGRISNKEIRGQGTSPSFTRRSREAPDGQTSSRNSQQCDSNNLSKTKAFHRELAETCADFLSKHTFSNNTEEPEHSALVSSWLLKDGYQQSWLLGNRVITITTSAREVKDVQATSSDSCSRCQWLLNSVDQSEVDINNTFQMNSDASSSPASLSRRRHRSAIESDPNSSSFQMDYSTSNENISTDELAGLDAAKKEIKSQKCSLSGSNYMKGCWCSQWAEIKITRATGVSSWLVKLQNPLQPKKFSLDGNDIPREQTFLQAPNSSTSPDMDSFYWVDQDFKSFSTNTLMSSSRLSRSLDNVNVPDNLCTEEDEKRRISLPEDTSQSIGDHPVDSKSRGPCQATNFVSFAAELKDKLPESPISQDTSRKMRKLSVPVGSNDEFHNSNSYAKCTMLSSNYETDDRAAYLFLQYFYHYSLSEEATSEERPLLLPTSDQLVSLGLERLNRLTPYQVHSIGVVYLSANQKCTEQDTLSNQAGSGRYTSFLHSLGRIIDLQKQKPQDGIHLGGLNSEEDGRWALVWDDNLTQVAFHVTTLMPAPQNESQRHHKKRHVGNDYVTIVYNESEQEWQAGTISGQFQFVNIVIYPKPMGYCLVKIVTKNNGVSNYFGSGGYSRVVSDRNLAPLVRTLAIQADLASNILAREARDPNNPFANCWVDRLRVIKRLRSSAEKARSSRLKGGSNHSNLTHSPASQISSANSMSDFLSEDFSDYV